MNDTSVWSVVFFIGFCITGGLVIYMVVIAVLVGTKQKALAIQMLGPKGPIPYQVEEILKTIYRDRNYNAPLKYLCRSVTIYIALGGTVDLLNRKIQSTVLHFPRPKSIPSPKIIFDDQTSHTINVTLNFRLPRGVDDNFDITNETYIVLLDCLGDPDILKRS